MFLSLHRLVAGYQGARDLFVLYQKTNGSLFRTYVLNVGDRYPLSSQWTIQFTVNYTASYQSSNILWHTAHMQ